jgi:hypothetical protein
LRPSFDRCGSRHESCTWNSAPPSPDYFVKYSRTAFAQIDGLANASLSRQAFASYIAYRASLMAKGENVTSIFTMLSRFVWDLYERGPGMSVH